jgi:hypothetical protein
MKSFYGIVLFWLANVIAIPLEVTDIASGITTKHVADKSQV